MLEIITTIFGLIQSILIMFNRKENWIFYILNIGTLIIYSFFVKLYGDVLENSIYLIIGLFGMFSWYSTKHSKYNDKIRYASTKERIFIFILFLLLFICIYIWLINTNDSLPLLDSITTGLSFVATITMALKIVDSWFYWLIDDILMAIVYFMLPNKAYFLMSLNIIWVFLAILSIYKWNKLVKLYEES